MAVSTLGCRPAIPDEPSVVAEPRAPKRARVTVPPDSRVPQMGQWGAMSKIAFSPDGARAIQFDDREALLWDVERLRILMRLETGRGAQATFVEDDGQFAIAGSRVPGGAAVFDGDTGEILRRFGTEAATPEKPSTTVFGPPDSGRAIVGGPALATLWDLGNNGRASLATRLLRGARVDFVRRNTRAVIWRRRPATGPTKAQLVDLARGTVLAELTAPMVSRHMDAEFVAESNRTKTGFVLRSMDTGEVGPTLDAGGTTRRAFFRGIGNNFAAQLTTGEVRVWSLGLADLLGSVKPNGEIDQVWLSEDGKRLATLGETNELWDLEKETRLATLGQSRALSNRPWVDLARLVHVPQRNEIWFGDREGFVSAWDLLSGQQVWRKRAHEDLIYGLASSADDSRAVVASLDGHVSFWDVGKSSLAATAKTNGGVVRRATFFNDRHQVAFEETGFVERTGERRRGWRSFGPPTTLWHTRDGEKLGELAGSRRLTNLHELPPRRGRYAIVWLQENVALWDLHRAEILATLVTPSGSSPPSLGTNADATRLAISRGRSLTLFEREGSTAIAKFEHPLRAGEINGSPAVLPGSTSVAVVRPGELSLLGADGSPYSLRLDETTTDLQGSGAPGPVVASPNGRWLTTIAEDAVLAFDLEDEARAHELRTPLGRPGKLDQAPKGSRVVGVRREQNEYEGNEGPAVAYLWDPATSDPIATYEAPPHPVDAAFSGDGSRFVLVADRFAVFEATSGKELAVFDRVAKPSIFDRVAVSPDGQRIIATLPNRAENRTLFELYDVETGKVSTDIAVPSGTGYLRFVAPPDGTPGEFSFLVAEGESLTLLRLDDAGEIDGTLELEAFASNDGPQWFISDDKGGLAGSAEALQRVMYKTGPKLGDLTAAADLGASADRTELVRDFWHPPS